jgi:chemotaxis protein MotB
MAIGTGRGQRFSVIIWPGFVDVMTALILVLFFVLSIFMIVQFVLRDTITGQGRELEELSVQVANLADALGLARSQADRQQALVATLTSENEALSGERATLQSQNAALASEKAAAEARITDFEAQVASLIARNTDLTGRLETSEAERTDLAGRLQAAEAERSELGTRLSAAEKESAERLSANEALELALARARSEVDAGAEAARLAAARREALEALVKSLQTDVEGLRTRSAEQGEKLTDAEAARLAEAAAAEELRKRLQDSDAELTAMTLSLEAERKKAEDTLTLLAAAEAATRELAGARTTALTNAEKRAAELAQANILLSEQKQISAEGQRQVALLNQQTRELREQLSALQGMLDTAEAKDAAAQVQIDKLGANLNAALARVAVEERRRAELEAREKERLAAEAKDLERYRSEFFGRMRDILGERAGVQVVGDRFVFPSEVLFAPGSATLGASGQAQVARVAAVIRDIADQIPPEIDWVLRVDGHTDRTPVSADSQFADNWELSQARALSVVRYMNLVQGIPADRLAATGFGEHRPVDPGSTPEALAKNRRIELKFTER